jgi:hypothetical protein
MSYSEYQALCEKAYDRMLEMKMEMIGMYDEYKCFEDCFIVTERQKKQYMTKDYCTLTHDQIMNDCGAQEVLIAFGLRDAWDRKPHR